MIIAKQKNGWYKAEQNGVVEYGTTFISAVRFLMNRLHIYFKACGCKRCGGKGHYYNADGYDDVMPEVCDCQYSHE